MEIHTVKSGDTIFSIADSYGALPSYVSEVNEINKRTPLCEGEELLLLFPTRTHTVRDGDTLSSISMRFDTKKREIIRANPSLIGNEALEVGRVLSVKHNSEIFGTAVSNGYFYKGCSIEKLKRAIPYATYVTVCALAYTRSGFIKEFDDAPIVKYVKKETRIPIVRIYDKTSGEYLTSKDRMREFCDEIIRIAREDGYSGVALCAYRAAEEHPEEFTEFLVEFRKRMIGSELILFTEIDELSNPDVAEYADGSVLTYDKLSSASIPSFEDGEKKVLSSFANRSESSKIFIDVSSLATDGEKYMSTSEAIAIARKNGLKIETDEKRGISKFKHQGRLVRFISLGSIIKRLSLLSEYGYMGISFDIMRVPLSYLMIYNAMFKTI